MPYVSNMGLRIHYEIDGQGPPLVLLHGFAGFQEMWQEAGGYVDKLKDNYQLTLIDIRGHGDSDKPHEPEAYEIESIVADVIAVLDQLKLEKSHYWGYSMGASIGFGLAKYRPERFNSFILGGTTPYSEDFDPSDTIRILEKGIDAYSMAFDEGAETIEKLPPLSPRFKTRMRANDPKALIALTRARTGWPCFGDILATVALPCLVYAGDGDTKSYLGSKACVSHLKRETFFSLPNLKHGGAFIHSELVLPHVTMFLQMVG